MGVRTLDQIVELLTQNLISPIVLAFVLGMVARAVRSDLEIPPALYQGLSIYLLLAIGLKGGVALAETPMSELIGPLSVTVVLGLITPISAYFLLSRFGKLQRIDAAATAAHYGSVSAVTFLAAIEATKNAGLLCLFLLELGMLAAGRLRDLKKAGWRLVLLGCFIPLVHGLLGTSAGIFCGMAPGGAAVFGAMVGSASYIAAPAAVRIALPKASPGIYLTLSLGVTFPFNLAIGVPLFMGFAQLIAN